MTSCFSGAILAANVALYWDNSWDEFLENVTGSPSVVCLQTADEKLHRSSSSMDNPSCGRHLLDDLLVQFSNDPDLKRTSLLDELQAQTGDSGSCSTPAQYTSQPNNICPVGQSCSWVGQFDGVSSSSSHTSYNADINVSTICTHASMNASISDSSVQFWPTKDGSSQLTNIPPVTVDTSNSKTSCAHGPVSNSFYSVPPNCINWGVHETTAAGLVDSTMVSIHENFPRFPDYDRLFNGVKSKKHKKKRAKHMRRLKKRQYGSSSYQDQPVYGHPRYSMENELTSKVVMLPSGAVTGPDGSLAYRRNDDYTTFHNSRMFTSQLCNQFDGKPFSNLDAFQRQRSAETECSNIDWVTLPRKLQIGDKNSTTIISDLAENTAARQYVQAMVDLNRDQKVKLYSSTTSNSSRSGDVDLNRSRKRAKAVSSSDQRIKGYVTKKENLSAPRVEISDPRSALMHANTSSSFTSIDVLVSNCNRRSTNIGLERIADDFLQPQSVLVGDQSRNKLRHQSKRECGNAAAACVETPQKEETGSSNRTSCPSYSSGIMTDWQRTKFISHLKHRLKEQTTTSTATAAAAAGFETPNAACGTNSSQTAAVPLLPSVPDENRSKESSDGVVVELQRQQASVSCNDNEAVIGSVDHHLPSGIGHQSVCEELTTSMPTTTIVEHDVTVTAGTNGCLLASASEISSILVSSCMASSSTIERMTDCDNLLQQFETSGDDADGPARLDDDITNTELQLQVEDADDVLISIEAKIGEKPPPGDICSLLQLQQQQSTIVINSATSPSVLESKPVRDVGKSIASASAVPTLLPSPRIGPRQNRTVTRSQGKISTKTAVASNACCRVILPKPYDDCASKSEIKRELMFSKTTTTSKTKSNTRTVNNWQRSARRCSSHAAAVATLSSKSTHRTSAETAAAAVSSPEQQNESSSGRRANNWRCFRCMSKFSDFNLYQLHVNESRQHKLKCDSEPGDSWQEAHQQSKKLEPHPRLRSDLTSRSSSVVTAAAAAGCKASPTCSNVVRRAALPVPTDSCGHVASSTSRLITRQMSRAKVAETHQRRDSDVPACDISGAADVGSECKDKLRAST